MRLSAIPVVNMARTGANIKHLRQQQGLTVQQLQDIFGFATPQAIYKWQQGTTLPTVDNLVMLSFVFHVPVESILAVDEV